MGLEVDMVDLAVFDMLKDFTPCAACKKMQDGEKQYFSVPYKKVLSELPLLPIKTSDGIYRRFKKLEQAGVLEMHPENAKMAMVWFAWGRNFQAFSFNATPGSKNEGTTKTPGLKTVPPRKDKHTPSDVKPTYTIPSPIPSPMPSDNDVAAKPPAVSDWETFEKIGEVEIAETVVLPLEEEKEKTPPGSAPPPKKEKEEPWTKSVAALFDSVGQEEGSADAFNWRINAGRDFKALKIIRDALTKDIAAKTGAQPSDSEISKGFEYLFRYGYRYLSGIAKEKGGAVQYSPMTIKNCYNQIISYAKANNGRKPEEPTNKATRQHDELSDYVNQRRRASIVRLYADQVGDVAGGK